MKFGYFKLLVGIVLLCLLVGISCNEQQETLFVRLDSAKTQIKFSNQLKETEDLNIVEYLYAHNGGGVAIGDVNNDNLPDIYFTANQLPNRLYLNKGDFVFEDITESSGVAGLSGLNNWTTGVTMADVNHDGHLDIYVSVVGNYKHFKGHNQLFINNGDLTFKESSQEYGLDLTGFCQQAYFFDYDLDGDLDMYQLRHAVHKPEVYVKADARKTRDSLSGDLLFRNENNRFINVSEAAGIYGGSAGYGLAAGIADFDQNGCPDIYVSNDFHENDFLYYNNCDGTFTEGGSDSMGHTSRFSMGNDIADLNNDGLFDIFTADMKPFDEVIRKKSAGEASSEIYDYRLGFGYQDQYSRNMLQLNRGPLKDNAVQFSEVAQQAGIQASDWSWGPLLVDLDNDGWKDLFITNGIRYRPNDLDYINFAYNEYAKSLGSLDLADKMPDGSAHNFAFKNKGSIEFADVSKEWGLNEKGYSMGASYADLDLDGDLDLVVNNLNAEASVFRNNTQEFNNPSYVRMRFIGPEKNNLGIGTKVRVVTRENDQTLQLNPARGWLSSVDYSLHFGLGKAKEITRVYVTWPDGKAQELYNVPVNKTLVLDYQNSSISPEESVENYTFFTPVDFSRIDFVHKENDYNDFQSERLLLRRLSTEGPKIALGDVNGDGLQDFYVCGAASQAGELYTQLPGNLIGFEKVEIKSFFSDRNYEDTDAVFFDVDSDGDQDLYVVSGGGETGGNKKLADRIYLNNGHGSFTKLNRQAMPETNGSSVVAHDFDGNGFIDVFVGARSAVGQYGISPKSTILWNHGNGILSADKKVDTFLNLGMVTDAVFLQDSEELVVVGEWMPITIIGFKGRAVAIREISNSSGWWNTIHAEDMDGDGDLDILAGNQGTNSGFKPTPENPLGLYVKDFDGNGSTDPIFTYWKHGKEWVYQDLDELKAQMVSIRKRFRNYRDFSAKTADQVVTASMRTNMVYKKVEILESVYLKNLGNGQFSVKELPEETQWSSIFAFETGDFDGDNIMDVVTVGNFHAFQPSIGRADASYGNFLKGNGKGGFKPIEPRLTGWNIQGEGRDIKSIVNKKGQSWLLVSRNDDALLVLANSNQLN